MPTIDELIHGRRHFSARRLEAPGPNPDQLQQIFAAAAAAPDHGQLLPWRFITIADNMREALGQVFEAALIERDKLASQTECANARAKAARGACLVLAVADLGEGTGNPVRDVERLVSLGAAIQNMLLAARALGFGSGLASGKAFESQVMRSAFSLSADEQPVCFLIFGTPSRAASVRQRPIPAQFVRQWQIPGGGDAS